MTHFFYASQMSNCERKRWRYILNREVILWLSKNLRKRPTDDGRRYDYYKSYETVSEKSLRTNRRRIKQKTYNIGVRIYNDEDAMAFKLRWL